MLGGWLDNMKEMLMMWTDEVLRLVHNAGFKK
jgi:hypothetical protein